MKKKLFICLLFGFLTVSSLNAFFVNFATGVFDGEFQNSSGTPTNGISVILVTFDGSGFSPDPEARRTTRAAPSAGWRRYRAPRGGSVVEAARATRSCRWP